MFDERSFRETVRAEGRVSRRTFLAYGAALSAIPLLNLQAQTQPAAKARFASDPFTLGVASGDPTDTGVVLWTRLAPKPAEGGGMPNEIVPVRWELATDDSMKTIVRKGEVRATPQLAHSVHVEVDGLDPERWYWYRFQTGDAVSPVGRTRTMPAPGAMPDKLRFAFASCQHFEAGHYAAYKHMAEDELDLVFHLGDYIYEGPGRDGGVRKHVGTKLLTLADYRNRYGQYRSDPLLHGMHALCPWVVTWDDHEVENDYAGDVSQNIGYDPAAFLVQRANAYQAYYEAMPLRRSSLPHGPHMQLYRTMNFGQLATFQVLDTRQYRTSQPNGDQSSPITNEVLNPKNTIMGTQQANWLKESLLQSAGTWNVIAQQVMIAMVARVFEKERRYSMDKWTGYLDERIKLLDFIADRKIPNPVVLTGDIHSNWVNDLRADDRKTDAPVVATEFVGTSISSGSSSAVKPGDIEKLIADNPGVKFHSRQCGYVRCTVTPDKWQSDFQVLADAKKVDSPANTVTSFVIESGQPGAKPA